MIRRFGRGMALVAALLAACKRERAPLPENPPIAVLPVPDSIVAEIAIASPDKSWSDLQSGIGGALSFMPGKASALLTLLTNAPDLAPEIDGKSPALAIVGADGDSLSFAIAFTLGDPRHTKSVLSEGDAAHFRPRAADGMVVLDPLDPAARHDVTFALIDGALIVASNEAARGKLGPYAASALRVRADAIARGDAISLTVPHVALAGVLANSIEAKWSALTASMLDDDARDRAAHGGRAPDFADPKMIVDTLDGRVRALIAAARDLEAAHVAITIEKDGLHATMTLTPTREGAIARARIEAMKPGDAAALLRTARAADLTLWTRDDAADRATTGEEIEGAITRALGKERLADADAKKLHAAFDDWAHGRGDWLTLEVEPVAEEHEQATFATIVRTSPNDAAATERASNALRETFELARVPAFQGPLAKLHVRDVALSPADFAPFGRGTIATLIPRAARKANAAASAPAPLGAGWIAREHELDLAVAADPARALRTFVEPTETLAADAAVVSWVQALASDATFALVARPSRLTAPSSNEPPVLVAWGRRDHAAWLDVRVAFSVVREAFRARFPF